MTARLIDGKQAAESLRAQVALAAASLHSDRGVTPGLAVVLVGDDPASQVYVRNKVGRRLKLACAASSTSYPRQPQRLIC